MILSLTGTWSINPFGPLRDSDDAEDLWSLINSTASIMSGAALSPWFVGESNDSEILGNGQVDTLVFGIYSADESSAPVATFLPSIMLAIQISLKKAYKPVTPSRITVELHPGDKSGSVPACWWGNFFNRIERYATWDLTVSPFSSELARKASHRIPYLFDTDGNNLTSSSWGLMETAALISFITEENAHWQKVSIDSRKSIVD